MSPCIDAVNPAPCSPACAAAVRRLTDDILPRALAKGLDRAPEIEAADSELDLSRFSARGRRWWVAGVVAALGGRTQDAMAAQIEARSGPGEAIAGCLALAETLKGGGGAAGLRLKGASEACCVFEFGPEAAAYWREVANRLSFRATQRILKEKAAGVKKL